MRYEKITDPDLMDAVHKRMLSQGHYVPHLSHVFIENDTVRAAISELWLPTVFCWWDLEDLHPITSVRIFKYIRDVLGPSKGHRRLLWPIPDTVAPFKLAERVGLTPGGQCHWFMSGQPNDLNPLL